MRNTVTKLRSRMLKPPDDPMIIREGIKLCKFLFILFIKHNHDLVLPESRICCFVVVHCILSRSYSVLRGHSVQWKLPSVLWLCQYYQNTSLKNLQGNTLSCQYFFVMPCSNTIRTTLGNITQKIYTPQNVTLSRF